MGHGPAKYKVAIFLGMLLLSVPWAGSGSGASVPVHRSHDARLAHSAFPAAPKRGAAAAPTQELELSAKPNASKGRVPALPVRPPSDDPTPRLANVPTRTPAPSTPHAPAPAPPLAPAPAPPLAPAPAPPLAACPSVGLFVSGERPSAAAGLASDLGVDAKVLTVYAYNAGEGPYTAFTFGPTVGLQLLLGVGAVTPAEATTIGDNLVAEGHANTMIRVMWEMNGNWEPWGTQALSPAQYISIYRAAEDAFEAVPGNHFTYVWNVSAGTVEPGRTEFDTYPGNAYVTNVGIDLYDEWGQYKNVPAIISFAQSHGKPVSFDEWGLDGSDDSSFIDFVSGVVHNPVNHVTLQAYFSFGSSEITKFPEAEAEYTRDFSGTC